MSFGISLRSTRQAVKPITINLKKTDMGYKLMESKESYSNTISLTKNMLFRTDSKSEAQSTQTQNKSVEKDVLRPSAQNLNASAPLPTSIHTTSNLRRQAIGKLPQTVNKTHINSAVIREKSPIARLETDQKQKREVFALNNYQNDTIINPVKSAESIIYFIHY